MDLRGLHPAILLVNRLVSDECAKTLYSKNTFALREHGGDVALYRQASHMSKFFAHIGHNSSLIRKLEIPFPAFYYENDFGTSDSNTYLAGADVETLETIMHFCTELRTLILFLSYRKLQSVSRDQSKSFETAVDDLSRFIQKSASKRLQVIVKVDAIVIGAELKDNMVEKGWRVVMDQLQ